MTLIWLDWLVMLVARHQYQSDLGRRVDVAAACLLGLAARGKMRSRDRS
jgi:hypothetical protein